MNMLQLSYNGDDNSNVEMREFNIRKKLTSSLNRLHFLKNCLLEQVLPRSAPATLKNNVKPFSDSARAYLEDACNELKDNIYVYNDERKGTKLTTHHEETLKRLNAEQRSRLSRKLDDICRSSNWKDAGNIHIVTNLSSRQLTDNEKEALSLGLKFDAGRDKYSFAEHVERNYKWNDSDVEKGFVQGIVTCCKALADKEPNSLPRRYIRALRNIANDSSVVVTQADKGGGVIIMDKQQYVAKMNEMLSDSETYEKKPAGYTEKQSKLFNQKTRKILKTSERGKKMYHLIEEAPTIPRMRGLPKVHKQNIPMRPITSGIGSAPHNIAKILAKPLTSALGSLSSAHIQNTTDMMQRLKEIDHIADKKLASFDVTALFTNVPIDGALAAIKKVVDAMDNENLPLPKKQYMQLVTICMEFGCFSFHGDEYVQHSGLAMGSPLSPVGACLYMEDLEQSHFMKIIGEDSIWMRYVDDVLVVVPKDTQMDEKLKLLNNVNPKVQFTLELEHDKQIAFLDTCIMRSDNVFKFKVYRKPTNKEDYVHFYSAHGDRVKSGIVIGFFLRAFRICTEEYLAEEIQHIYETFIKLKYPKGFLIKQKKKAEQIINKKSQPQAKNLKRKPEKWIIIPYSKQANVISKELEKIGVRVAMSSGKKIQELVCTKEKKKETDKSVVYEIPCTGCNKTYVGETGRGIQIRLKEHKSDVKFHRTSNAIVLHIDTCHHLPNWEETKVLEKNISKKKRKTLEAAHIITRDTFNSRSGFITWSGTAAKLAVS